MTSDASRLMLETTPAMVKPTQEIDESASDVVGVDVSPPPADCGLDVDGSALVVFVDEGARTPTDFPKVAMAQCRILEKLSELIELLAEMWSAYGHGPAQVCSYLPTSEGRHCELSQ